MAQPQPGGAHDDEQLRGTFAIVLIIGAIILVVWLCVFFLFLSRF